MWARIAAATLEHTVKLSFCMIRVDESSPVINIMDMTMAPSFRRHMEFFFEYICCVHGY